MHDAPLERQESSEKNLRALTAIWDFLFGALCIGAAPVIAVMLTRLAAETAISRFGNRGNVTSLLLELFSFPAVIVAPIASVWMVIQWRSRYRRVRKRALWLEVVVGLLAGAAFGLYALLLWAFSGIQ